MKGLEPQAKGIGTKRRAAIESGADEMLEEHGGEEDEDEEDVLTDGIIL